MKNEPMDIRERTFAFALMTLKYCRKIQEEQREYIVTKQLSRSATSVGANVREARNAEVAQTLYISLEFLKRNVISLYWLELLKEFVQDENNVALKLHAEGSELLKILRTIILRTKNNPDWKRRP